MREKPIKLIMELIFIFILPLLFICFTSEIQIERNFEYDNNGNYETSIESKNLSFDNSIIKYTKTITIEEINLNYDWAILHNTTIYFNLNDLAYNDVIDGYEIALLDNKEYQSIQIINDMGTLHLNITGDYGNEDLIGTNETINNITYLKFENCNGISTNITWDFNYGYYTYINTTNTTNTIWGNIKKLIIDSLQLNDNILLDIVICYTILWTMMFLLWHVWYGLFELLFHVIPKGRLRC